MGNVEDYVYVLGDWDADGLVSSALVKYSQESLGLYPLSSKYVVKAAPTTSRNLGKVLRDISRCPKALVLLDLPYVRSLERVLKGFKKVCKDTLIIYVDHHISTFDNVDKLEKCVNSILINPSPTTRIVYEKIRSLGGRVTPRLEAFAKVITYMDEGVKVPSSLEKIGELVIEISKALAVAKDEALWLELLGWLSEKSLIPRKSVTKILSKVSELAKKLDKEVKEIALDLSMTAKKVGYVKYIRLKKKNYAFSSTVLASKIYYILKSTIALRVPKRGYDLLIIKGRKGVPYRMAIKLRDLGVIEDIGGHESLIVAKLKGGVDDSVLEIALREASLPYRMSS